MIDNRKVVIAFNAIVGIAIGTTTDPNYAKINPIFPYRKDYLVVHKSVLLFTSLSSSDVKDITNFSEFQQAYPEYFI